MHPKSTPEIPVGYCQCGCGKPIKSGNTYVKGHQLRRPFSQRYIVDTETGCWNWTGARVSRDGYGYLSIDYHRVLAHIHSWERVYGPKPPDTHLHHTCENKQCVNPDHLECLIPMDHLRKHFSPFSEHDRAIIKSLRGVVTGEALARRFGCTPTTISRIQLDRRQ